MVNGPPCAVCGGTLRWVPEQHGWWCDRCQTLAAASGPHQRAHSPSQQGRFKQTMLGATRPAGLPTGQPAPPAQETSGAQPSIADTSGAVPASPYAPGNSAPVDSPFAPHAPGATDGVPNPYAGPREASQPYSPVPLHRPAPVAGPPRKSKKGLVIGLVAAVALVAIIVAVVVATGGGGTNQRDSLAIAAFAALADEKQLTELMDAEKTIDKFLDCSPGAKGDDDDDDDFDPDRGKDKRDKGEESRRRHIERSAKEIEKAVEMAKGAKIEVIEVLSKLPPPSTPARDDDGKVKADDKKPDDDEDDKPKRKKRDKDTDPSIMKHEVGSRVMSGCFAKVDHTIQLVKVKLRVTPEGKSSYEDRATIVMVSVVGDKWYVLAPPRVYTGDSEVVAKARTFRDRMCDCKDMDCHDAVDDDFDKWREKKATELPDDEDAGFDSVRDDYRTCASTLKEANKGAGNTRAIKQMTATRDEMCACKDTECVDRVRKAQKYPDYDYDDDDVRKQISKLREEISECSVKVMMGSTPRYDPDLIIEPDIAPACDDYARAMKKLVACDKYPGGAKSDLKESFKTMMNLWKGYSMMKPELQRATTDTCISGRRSTQESMTKYGCF